jgi:hypothetical protein
MQTEINERMARQIAELVGVRDVTLYINSDGAGAYHAELSDGNIDWIGNDADSIAGAVGKLYNGDGYTVNFGVKTAGITWGSGQSGPSAQRNSAKNGIMKQAF